MAGSKTGRSPAEKNGENVLITRFAKERHKHSRDKARKVPKHDEIMAFSGGSSTTKHQSP
ncbi:hypothetical protein A2U01_0061952, partial [Trifolium medium]|nr:hypothetical protein [Trifolium medium]